MSHPPMGAPSPETGSKSCPLCGRRYDASVLFCQGDGQPLRDDSTDDPLMGTLVGKRFLVERKLGQGGMGSVYQALQVTMDRRVALKVLHLSRLDSDRDAMLRFSREASNASKVTHINVASVFDFSVSAEDGVAYLAMELVEGESLGALVARERVLAPRRAASIAYQVADALAAAHEQGLIHRDLKPDNVMLARRADGSDLVKVVDFGISRVMNSETQRVTSTGLAIGTPQYMSPEQLQAGEIDARTDVYALGLICYRMLAGDLPWPSDSREQVLTQRLVRPRRTLAEIRPEVAWPDDLQRVLDAAIAIDAEQRYPTAIGMAMDLVAVVQQWIPDDPQAEAVWDRRLRMATPVGLGRIFAGDRASTVGTGTGGGVADATRGPTVDGGAGRGVGALSGAEPAAGGGPGTGSPSAAPAATPSTDGARRSRTLVLAGVAGAVVLALAIWRFAPGGGAVVEEQYGPLAEVAAAPASTGDSSAVPVSPGQGAGSLAGDQGGQAQRDERAAQGSSGTPPAATDQGAARPQPTTAKGGAAPQRETAPEASAPAGDVRERGESRPAPALSAADARAALEQMAHHTRPDATESDARAALRLMGDVLPQLTDLRDIVEAQLRGAEAHLILDQPAQACSLLLRIERDAAATARRASVQAYLSNPELACRSR